jgi:hypothetical protein
MQSAWQKSLRHWLALLAKPDHAPRRLAGAHTAALISNPNSFVIGLDLDKWQALLKRDDDADGIVRKAP